MTGSTSTRWLMLVLAALAVLAIGACGGDDDGGDGSTASKQATATDRAFLEAMVPHHESAVAMTEVAARRAEAPEIRDIAEGIAAAQKPEIEQMGGIHVRLFGAPLVPAPGAHEELGLTAEEAGGGHDDAARELEDSDPFDRAFVDEMVPHHEGAVRMAEAVLADTEDAELRELAEGIVETQKREIAEMNEFRERQYGAPVPEHAAPAGDAPPEAGGEHGGGHSG